jgi:hypothetical protein
MRALLLVAGAVLAFCVDAALLILLPTSIVTTPVYVNVALLGLSIFWLFLLPTGARLKASDASVVASIGPQMLVSGLLLGGVAIALWISIHGLSSVAYAIDMVVTGLFVCAQILIKVARSKINVVTLNDEDRRRNSTLSNRLTKLSDGIDDEFLRSALHKIADRVRYGPTPASNVTRDVDLQLDVLLTEFPLLAADAASSSISLRRLDDLISQRAQILADHRRQA